MSSTLTVADSDARPIPNTGVYKGECASGVEPQNTGREHRSNGHGGDRASYRDHASVRLPGVEPCVERMPKWKFGQH